MRVCLGGGVTLGSVATKGDDYCALFHHQLGPPRNGSTQCLLLQAPLEASLCLWDLSMSEPVLAISLSTAA